MPESSVAPGPPPEAAPPSPPDREGSRIDHFSYYVLRRLNLGGLLLLAAGLTTADFLSAGQAFWTWVFTGLEAAIALPWAWTVVTMDRAEARILDSKRLGRFRRVAGHAVTFAALAAVLLAKVLILQRADAADDELTRTYRIYVVFVFVLFVVGLLGRGSRLARFLGSVADHPARLMAISFAIVAVLGGFLLTLPVSLRDWRDANFVDGLFTSTSAVCVTGLTVNDVSVTYTPFGQAVIFLLIQAGGLGIMVLTASVAILAGRRLRTRSTAALTEMIDAESYATLRRTIRHIFVFTVVIEAVGAVVLWIAFAGHPAVGLGYEAKDAAAGAGSRVWSAVFHSVSAFCNAGFSLCHENLMAFTRSSAVSLAIAALIVLGGLGFPVLDEVWLRWKQRRRGAARRFSLHSRVALSTTAVLLSVGTSGYLLLEWDGTLAPLAPAEKLLAAFFQSVTSRTAGFNTVNFAAMIPPALLFTCLLMFVGGSPGSCAGGIKTTTAATLLAAFRAEVRGAGAPRLFDRALPDVVARKAAAVAVGSAVVVAAGWFVLLLTESGTAALTPMKLLFETVSAFATCGLSAGVTPELSAPGRIVVTALMFVGRVGPMTLALAVVARPRSERFTVPSERILIG